MNDLTLLLELSKARRNAKLSREAVRKKQEQKLRKLLHYAYEHSDFYRNKFEEAGINALNLDQMPLSAFPTTDKDEIMCNYPKVVTEEAITQTELLEFDESKTPGLFLNRYQVVHSSGSTGVPRYFIYDEKAWQQLLVYGVRSLLWDMSWSDILKLTIGKINILYVAVTGSRFGGAMMVSEETKVLHGKMLCLDVNKPFENWRQEVTRFMPTVIMGYPSAIRILTEELERSKISIPVKRILSCGEVLTSTTRAYLENYYQTTVVNFYAATESLVLGVETDNETGMFLLDDMNYIEIVDGVMYLTNLYNYSQPIIRYRVSDSVEMLPDTNGSCGFSRCRVKAGRAEDIMWFSDQTGRKDFIHPTLLEDFYIIGLMGYQFRQQSSSSFCVDIEVAPDGDPESIRDQFTEAIRQLLRSHCMEFVSFEVRVIDCIMPDSESGKRRLCISLPDTTAS